MATMIKAVKSHSASELAIAEVVQLPVPAKKYVKTYDVIIIGAGPAGAYCGYCLTRQGVQSIILDHSHPREKPCGGIISNRVVRKFPLIQAVPYTSDVKNTLEVTAPSGQKVMFDRDRGHSVSRRVLDRYLLDSAIRLGCKFVPEEARSISTENGLWVVKTGEREVRGRILIGADGTRSIVRKTVAHPFNREDLAIGIGYLAAESKKSSSQIKFIDHQKGFSWKVNRELHCSIGTIDSLNNASTLKTELDRFLVNNCSDAHPFARWSALVPRASSANFFQSPCAGRNWALIGDAAGHVHPMTGEGILYALWSAELAAQAIYSGDSRLFDSLWRDEYGKELGKAVVAQKLLYNKSALDTSLWFCARSSTLSEILHAVWSGDMHSSSAWLRTLYNVPLIGLETALKEFKRAFS